MNSDQSRKGQPALAVETDRRLARTLRLTGATLVLVAGLQVLKALQPSVSWYLGESLPIHAIVLFLVLLVGFALVAPLLRRVASPVTLVAGSSLVVLTARLILQFSANALTDLIASAVGVGALMIVLAISISGLSDERGSAGLTPLATALPLALFIDTALKVGSGNLEVLWRRDILSVLLVALLVVAAAVLTVFASRTSASPSIDGTSPRYGVSAWGAGTIGVVLVTAISSSSNQVALQLAADPVHAAVVSPQPTEAWLSGWTTLLTIGVGWFVANWAIGRDSTTLRWTSILTGAVAAACALLLLAGLTFGGVILPVLGAALVCTLVLMLRPTPLGGKVGLGTAWAASIGLFSGFVVALMIRFALAYNIDEAVPVAGILVGIAAIASGIRSVPRQPDQLPILVRSLSPAVLGSALLVTSVIVSTASISTTQPPSAVVSSNQSVKVMTLNVHQGLDAANHVNIEGLANLVREQNPDVLALQEVDRGRSSSGYNDVLTALSIALDMPYIYGGNSHDGLFGNALLSRLPVNSWSYHQFEATSGETRGVLEASLQVSQDGPELTLFATHLDHIEGAGSVRAAQLAELAAIWDGRSHSIVLGDLNLPPDSPELSLLTEAGFTDTLVGTKHADATTWIGIPASRVDYVLVSPRITVDDVSVVDSRASDHKPIVAVITVDD